MEGLQQMARWVVKQWHHINDSCKYFSILCKHSYFLQSNSNIEDEALFGPEVINIVHSFLKMY